ncbi:hypothetical protein G4B88_015822 [Cannabis sativa]|uniref:Uncharacterized protein n=2 Tax=Cannabis sativa TaxID=3483 RepID=A0A7J6EQ90_CANSA|nr:hypothetical protein G4B88_015822 [Cannabis sativa]
MEINNKIGVMMMMMSYIVVVALVFNLPSTTTAVSAGRTLNLIQELHSSRSDSESDHARRPIEVYDHNGKMVTVIEPASIAETMLMEFVSSPEKNQCWGKFCAPWSPCQSGCICVGLSGTGACAGV